jgi:hypothetical protein
MEPVFLRRSFRAASGLPKFTGAGSDVLMSKCGDAMANRNRMSLLMSFWGMLEGLPGMLLSSQVIFFPVLLANTVGVRGLVL